jgi:metallo-beta-lactamase class B
VPPQNNEREAGLTRIVPVKHSFYLIVWFAATSIAFGQADPASRAMNQPVPPFRIAGNLYYVGATEVSSFLITTSQGDFLLDGGFAETAQQIERNVAQLGFKIEDIKILLNSHAHFDHAGGLAELKQKSSAKFIANAGDAELLKTGGHGDFRFGDTLLFPPIQPDQIIRDGESIRLGDQVMTAHSTPGHTKGNTTWTTKIRDGDKTYDVVFVGSQSSLDYKFVGQESYPGIRADFEKSFAILKNLPCDIFLGSHGSFFNFLEKRERVLRGEMNAFIDPDGYKRYLMESEKDFREKVAKQESK